MDYITERKDVTPKQETPGSGQPMSGSNDINMAVVPGSKEEGGNLKAVEQNIQARFDLDSNIGDDLQNRFSTESNEVGS